MVKLYLEGEQVDLYGEENISLTFTNADISKLSQGDTKGNFSYAFKIPATSRNKKLLSFPELILDESFDETQERSALLEESGNTIVNGFARIKEVVKSGNIVNYEIVVFDGNGGWISAIKGKSIRTLSNLSEYDHTLTRTVQLQSENYQLGNLYAYGLFDFGRTIEGGGRFSVEDRPLMFNIYRLIQLIFLDSGYTFQSDFFTTDFFQRLFMSSDRLPFRKESDLIPHKVSAHVSSETNIGNINLINGSDRVGQEIIVNFDTFSYADLFAAVSPAPSVVSLYNDGESKITSETLPLNGGLTFITANRYKVNNFIGRMSFVWDYGFYSRNTSNFRGKRSDVEITLRLRRYRNGILSTLESREVVMPGIIGTITKNTTPVELLGNFTTESYEVRDGDRYYFTYEMNPTKSLGTYIDFGDFWEFGQSTANRMYNNVYNTVVEGAPIVINEQIPDINQDDLLISLKKAFNLYFYTDEINKTVYVEPRDTFYTEDAEDWSSKVDLSKDISITNLGGSLNKKIKFRYNEDTNDRYVTLKEKELFGGEPLDSIEIDVSNKSASEGVTTRTIDVFAPTFMGKGILFAPSAKIPKLWDSDSEERPAKKMEEWTPRLLYYKGKTGISAAETYTFEGVNYNYYPEFTTNYIDLSGSSLTHNNSLSWSDTSFGYGLKSRYYQNTIDTINNSRALTMHLYLNSVDIQNLSFRRPKYIEINGNGDYYHLEAINNYVPGKIRSVECRLVKVINPVPLAEKLSIQTSNIYEVPGKELDQGQTVTPVIQNKTLLAIQKVWQTTDENPSGEFVNQYAEVDAIKSDGTTLGGKYGRVRLL